MLSVKTTQGELWWNKFLDNGQQVIGYCSLILLLFHPEVFKAPEQRPTLEEDIQQTLNGIKDKISGEQYLLVEQILTSIEHQDAPNTRNHRQDFNFWSIDWRLRVISLVLLGVMSPSTYMLHKIAEASLQMQRFEYFEAVLAVSIFWLLVWMTFGSLLTFHFLPKISIRFPNSLLATLIVCLPLCTKVIHELYVAPLFGQESAFFPKK